MLRGFCGSFELCSESEKALDWLLVVYSQKTLFCRESRALLLGHSVVLHQLKLPILSVCLYQRVKLFFSCLKSRANCTVE